MKCHICDSQLIVLNCEDKTVYKICKKCSYTCLHDSGEIPETKSTKKEKKNKKEKKIIPKKPVLESFSELDNLDFSEIPKKVAKVKKEKEIVVEAKEPIEVEKIITPPKPVNNPSMMRLPVRKREGT